MSTRTQPSEINQPSLLFGIATGMRSMTGLAALCWAGWLGRAHPGLAPTGITARNWALALAAGEIAGDKMPFAPDRRIPASFAFRLALGAAGGAALSGPDHSLADGALSGVLGAIVGTLAGRFFRGPKTCTRLDWMRALTEDASAAVIATTALRLAGEAVTDHSVRARVVPPLRS